MNIVDSSAWLEYFADSPSASHFAGPIEDTSNLIVPSVVIYEVFKRVLQQRGEAMAIQAVAHMRLGKTVELDASLAISAANLSYEKKIPMADSIILATAQKHRAIVWTQDDDFKGIENVKYFSKKDS